MSPPGVTGRDLGVPVRHQDVVPVDVLPVHVWVAIPGVVEDVNVVEDGPLGSGVGQSRLGVGAASPGRTGYWTRGGGGRGPLQTRSQIREAVTGLQGPQPHHGPEDKQCEEEEGDAGSPAESCHVFLSSPEQLLLKVSQEKWLHGCGPAPALSTGLSNFALQPHAPTSPVASPRLQEEERKSCWEYRFPVPDVRPVHL